MPKSHRGKRKANRLMEAYRIKRRFRKLLIITNLEELKKDDRPRRNTNETERLWTY